MMDGQERPEANEVEMDEQERREVNEARELYEKTVSASRQAGATRREEVEQRRAASAAAEQFADAVRASYQAVADRSVSAQALNAQLTQQFVTDVINNLRTQTEDTREMSQQLADQQRRTQEAGQALTQESVGVYMEFLNSIFSFAPGRVQGWDESEHQRNFEGRFERGEAWDESEHQRDAGGGSPDNGARPGGFV